MMRSNLAVYLVTGVFLFWLVLLPHWRWRRCQSTPVTPKSTRGKREPKLLAGYTCKPECELCESGVASHPQVPTAPPPRMILTRGRRRHLDTTGHFCPHAECAYHGLVDWGISAPTAIPMAGAGANSSVWAATGISWKRLAHRFTPSRVSPTGWSGPLRRWPKASASAPWPGLWTQHRPGLACRGGGAPGGLLARSCARSPRRAGADG